MHEWLQTGWRQALNASNLKAPTSQGDNIEGPPVMIEDSSPCCQQRDQDVVHVYLCPNSCMRSTLKDAIHKIRDRLCKPQIPAQMWLEIHSGISLVTGLPSFYVPGTSNLGKEINNAAKQSAICWQYFVKCHVYQQWSEVMAVYYNQSWCPCASQSKCQF